jgi:hypothetical protein
MPVVGSAGKHVQFGTPERKNSKEKAPRGRLCAASGCATVLSIYNASDSCWSHTEAPHRPPLHRG